MIGRTGRPTAAAIACLLAATACGGRPSIPAVELQISVRGPDTAVEFGEAFAIEVTRVWSHGLKPVPWDDNSLAPLIASTRDVVTWDDGGRTMEVRTLAAHAFGLPQVAVEGLRLDATADDGGAQTAVAADLIVDVTSSLPGHGDAIEGPDLLEGEPLLQPRSAWALLTAIAVLVGGWWWWRRRRRAAATAPDLTASEVTTTANRLDPAAVAVEALDALDTTDPIALHERLDGVLRRYLEDRYGWPASWRTTLEVVRHSATLGIEGDARRDLAGTLAQCDLVKFAAHRPERARSERAVASARAFVAATTAAPTSDQGADQGAAP